MCQSHERVTYSTVLMPSIVTRPIALDYLDEHSCSLVCLQGLLRCSFARANAAQTGNASRRALASQGNAVRLTRTVRLWVLAWLSPACEGHAA